MPSSAPPELYPLSPTRRSSDLSRCGQNRLHRQRRSWQDHCQERGGHAQARHPRTWRQITKHFLRRRGLGSRRRRRALRRVHQSRRSEEHTSELQSRGQLVCRLLRPPSSTLFPLHDALPIYPGVDKIAFTGSAAVGKIIVKSAADTLKRVTLELGGKSPNIFFDGADWEAAVDGALFGVFINQGDRKSTRLNSSHVASSYAVFCAPRALPSFPYTTLFRSIPVWTKSPSPAAPQLARSLSRARRTRSSASPSNLAANHQTFSSTARIGKPPSTARSSACSSIKEIGRAHV